MTTGTPHDFWEQPSIDGRTFDGIYFLQLPSGEKPTLSLALDGRLIDQGLLGYVDEWIYPFRVSDAAGEGAYAVTNFTIVFRYTDGRILRLPFSGLGLTPGDPSPTTLAIGIQDDFLTLSDEKLASVCGSRPPQGENWSVWDGATITWKLPFVLMGEPAGFQVP